MSCEYRTVSGPVATEGPGNSSAAIRLAIGSVASTARMMPRTGATALRSLSVSRKRASMTGGSPGAGPETCTELVVRGRIG